jgi:hypothetical protein
LTYNNIKSVHSTGNAFTHFLYREDLGVDGIASVANVQNAVASFQQDSHKVATTNAFKLFNAGRTVCCPDA